MKKTAVRIYKCLRQRGLLETERLRRDFIRLNRDNTIEIEDMIRDYYVELIQKTFWLILLTVLISIGVLIMNQTGKSGEFVMTRSDYGEEATQYGLVYTNEEQKQEKLTIELEPVQYSPEELKQQFLEGFAYLESEMLGKNVSFDNVQDNLELLTEIPESGLNVTWISEDFERIDDNGTVHNEDLEKAIPVHLWLELEYEDQIESREYEVLLQPKQLTGTELQKQEIRTEIEKLIQEQPYEKEIILPKEIHGVQIEEDDRMNLNAVVLILMGIVIGVLLWFKKREELQKKIKEQNQQLMKEYPNLVNQLLLYIGAGATVSGAFQRIIQQYEDAHKKNHNLYKELVIMRNAMHSGVTQEQAYADFGKRIGLLPYLRLSSLLIQQLRKGTDGIVLQLEQEEHDAFANRKEQARKTGEEAGTKLLFPMLILMIISMMIVVSPALMNFTI